MDQSLKTLELTTKLNSMELDSQIKVAANLIIAYRFQVAPGVYAFGTDRQIEYTTNKGINKMYIKTLKGLIRECLHGRIAE